MTEDFLQAFRNATLKHVGNRRERTESVRLFSDPVLSESFETISAWRNYRPTDMMHLYGLARELGVADILYKDEGSRFGLGSFKALGGAYAVDRLLASIDADPTTVTVACATDGNHGLSVAWGAKLAGCRCVVYIHAEVSAGREQNLRDYDAEVVRIDGNYDDSVATCAADARENNWFVISDTSTSEDFRDVPTTVMAGYTVMAAEIVEQVGDTLPSHVFLQGGVGGLAASVCEYLHSQWSNAETRFVIVEPELAPCLFVSAEAGKRTAVDVTEETLMAGLSCGEPSIVAWPVLERLVDHFLTVPETVVTPTMRLLRYVPFGDDSIVAGESAVAGLAGFIAGKMQDKLAETLALDTNSRVLVIGTEGATDPELYEALTG